MSVQTRNGISPMKSQIESAARQLFLEKGFAATSYRDIAEVIGKEKTHVQKHFPKKSLFVERFFEDLLNVTDTFYRTRGFSDEDYFQNLYRIGVIQFAFLLSSPSMERFTFDILSDRSLTESLIQEDMRWAAGYLSGFSLEEQEDFKDCVAVVMGGVYEKVYQHLLDGRPTDPQELMTQAIRLFAFTLGFDPEATAAMLQHATVPADLVGDAVRHLQENLFST